jgi:hypothetical protein
VQQVWFQNRFSRLVFDRHNLTTQILYTDERRKKRKPGGSLWPPNRRPLRTSLRILSRQRLCRPSSSWLTSAPRRMSTRTTTYLRHRVRLRRRTRLLTPLPRPSCASSPTLPFSTGRTANPTSLLLRTARRRVRLPVFLLFLHALLCRTLDWARFWIWTRRICIPFVVVRCLLRVRCITRMCHTRWTRLSVGALSMRAYSVSDRILMPALPRQRTARSTAPA